MKTARNFFCSIVYDINMKANVFIILASVIFPLTLIATYSISLNNKHIIPVWPYISHTGDDPVESCFFSLGLNIISGLYASIVYLRYLQIRCFLAQDPNKFHNLVNNSSLFWGLVAAFTLSVTSSFQQKNISFVHLVAAVVCSYTALVYFWHQTLFSRVYMKWITRKMKIFRTVLSISSTFIHSVAPCLYTYSLINHPMPDGKITEWNSDVETMALYLTGSFMEWFVFVLNELYIASFYWEFEKIRLKSAEITIIKEEVERI